MKNDTYKLSTIEFIGGVTSTYLFNLWFLTPDEAENKDTPYNANGCTINFSIVNYSNKNDEPILTKKCEIRQNEDGISSIAVLNLAPADTKNLSGKFIYQLSIRNGTGDVEAEQGILYINKNIDKGFVDGATRIAFIRL